MVSLTHLHWFPGKNQFYPTSRLQLGPPRVCKFRFLLSHKDFSDFLSIFAKLPFLPRFCTKPPQIVFVIIIIPIIITIIIIITITTTITIITTTTTIIIINIIKETTLDHCPYNFSTLTLPASSLLHHPPPSKKCSFSSVLAFSFSPVLFGAVIRALVQPNL